MENVKESIIKEAKRIEEDSLYSAKGHFKAANRWMRYHLWLGIPSVLLAVFSGASLLSQFGKYNVLAGISAVIVSALTAVSTFLNPNERANCHQNAGNKYTSLRNKARIFYQIDCSGENSIEELKERLTELANLRDELNENSPQIPRWAYEKARKGIQEGEAEYEVDKKE